MYEENIAVRDTSRDGLAIAKVPMSEIPSALAALDENNSRLAEAVGVLSDRTAPLRNQADQESREDQAVRDHGSDLARAISDQAHRVRIAYETVEKILKEMEI